MKVTRWISHATTVILCVLLVLMLFFVISSKISGGEPNIFGYQLKSVLSGSMEPNIQTGSIIAVKPVEDPTQFEKGDIITYKSVEDPNKLITHRILEVQKEGSTVQYVTMGDNNDAKDPKPIPANNVTAEYLGFTIPFIGYILNFVQSKLGNVLFLIVPGVLLIIWSVISIWRAISEMESKEEDVKQS